MACVPKTVVCVSLAKNSAVGMAALWPSSGITHSWPSSPTSAAAELDVPKSIPSTMPCGRSVKASGCTGALAQYAGQKDRDIHHFARMHAVLHGVAVPLHRVAQLGQQLARGLAPGRRH